MLHILPTNLFLLAAKQEPYLKKPSLNEQILENFLEKSSEERISTQKKDKTERVTGLGKKQTNKRGDSKVESNDSPEIPDRRDTSDIPGLPSGGRRGVPE